MAISFDGWTLHRDVGELERDGKRQRLQDLPLRILIELLGRPGELVTREQLIARLWPQGIVDFDTSLNTAVSKLRKALGEHADRPRYIETVPRKGYRFIGNIDDEVVSEAKSLEPESIAPSTSIPARGFSNKYVVLWIGGALSVLLVIALFLFNTLSTETAPRIRLAVMPFENLSSDSANAFFADGMHEEILSTLTNRAKQMDVISRTTMMTYRARPKTVSEIARELAVTHVLEGSVRREGRAVRVTLQLIDARNDEQVWSNNYDRQLTNAMTLQAQMAQEVATQLSIKLSPPSNDLPASTVPDAYDLYLRAKLEVPLISQRTSPATLLATEQSLSRAIELDPAFAAAYVQRAQLRIKKYVWNFDLSEANVRDAKEDIESAHRLAGDHPEVLQVLSRHAWMQGGSERARRVLELPQTIASNNPTVMRWRAFTLCREGRLEEGLKLFARIDELDPSNSENVDSWTRELWNAQRGAEALRVIQTFNRRGAVQLAYGDLMFAFTGALGPLRNDVGNMSDTIDPDTRLAATYDLLRYERRFPELLQFMQREPPEDGANIVTVRARGFREPTAPGIGSKPLAELRAWSNLLNGNLAAAVSEGQTLLRYVATTRSTNDNGATHLRILQAEGELFSGNQQQAITEARAALAMLPPAGTVRRFAAGQLARVFAWAGAEEDAVTLLEEISTRFPMLGPAEITRDPLYSLPLSENARYKILEKKLEAEIANNQALFASVAR